MAALGGLSAGTLKQLWMLLGHVGIGTQLKHLTASEGNRHEELCGGWGQRGHVGQPHQGSSATPAHQENELVKDHATPEGT